MIAACPAQLAAALHQQTSRQRRIPLRFHFVDMTHFLFDILSNLALLAVVLIACHLLNHLIPGTALDGRHVFTALMIAALLFDAALTFLVFADARHRYGEFSTPGAFLERASAYGFATLAAFAWRFVARRLHVGKVRSRKVLVIRTSPYSESHLPM